MSRAATPADVGAASACLASAFHEDPLWGGWAFPREAERSARLAELMRFWVQGALPHGWVRMSENAEAVAVWLPPGAAELSPDEQAAFEAFVERALGPRAGELTELFDRFEHSHPRRAPHYYLSLWGTHRNSAGKGLGAKFAAQQLTETKLRERATTVLSAASVVVPVASVAIRNGPAVAAAPLGAAAMAYILCALKCCAALFPRDFAIGIIGGAFLETARETGADVRQMEASAAQYLDQMHAQNQTTLERTAAHVQDAIVRLMVEIGAATAALVVTLIS